MCNPKCDRERNAVRTHTIADYGTLMARLLNGTMPAQEFKVAYIQAFKSDPTTSRPEKLFDLLNDAFTYADSFSQEPQEIGPWAIDEQELRVKIRQIFVELQEYEGRSP
jgi:Bacterial self-protective colicin-like immunity